MTEIGKGVVPKHIVQRRERLDYEIDLYSEMLRRNAALNDVPFWQVEAEIASFTLRKRKELEAWEALNG